MKKREILLLGIFLLVFSGCAVRPHVFLQDGTPAPTILYMEKNLRSGMTAEAYVSRLVLQKDDEGEEVLQPAEFLKLGTKEIRYLKSDTVAISGAIRISNPSMTKYTLIVVYEINNKVDRWPYIVSRVLYVGNSPDETFEIRRWIEKTNPEIVLRVVIQEGELERLREEEILFEFITGFTLKS